MKKELCSVILFHSTNIKAGDVSRTTIKNKHRVDPGQAGHSGVVAKIIPEVAKSLDNVILPFDPLSRDVTASLL